MNTLLLGIITIPVLEIWIMIEVGGEIGALNTIILIFLTAILGIYYAKIQGLNTIKSGFTNLYQNKIPIYEIISGASIAIASVLLILPGFLTDLTGFILLFPFSRNIIIKNLVKNYSPKVDEKANIVDGEIIDDKELLDKNKDKDEL